VPQVARVAFLFNPANPFFTLDLPNLETDARALGLQLQPVAVCQADEFDGAFATIIEHRPNALYLGDDGLLNRHLQPIMHFATTHQLPTMGTRRKTAEAGSLMAFGYSRRELIQRAAVYVDKILKGPSLVICPSSGPRHSSWSSTVRPEKADALSGRQSRRGKSQSPVTWMAGWRETETLKPIDQAIVWMVRESPGRNERERRGGPERPEIRRPSLTVERRRQHGSAHLAEATRHSGGVRATAR
jgi:ABC transporter substrate binding protein